MLPCDAGYRVARLAGGGLGAGACAAVAHPFNVATATSAACATMAQRVLAIETHPSCLVRIYVLGDPQCSVEARLAALEG